MGKSPFFAASFHLDQAITSIVYFEDLFLAISITVKCGFALDIIAETATKSLVVDTPFSITIFSVFAGVLLNAHVLFVDELSFGADRLHDRPTI